MSNNKKNINHGKTIIFLCLTTEKTETTENFTINNPEMKTPRQCFLPQITRIPRIFFIFRIFRIFRC